MSDKSCYKTSNNKYSDCPPNKNNHSIWATKIHSEMNNNSKYSYFIKW